MFSCEFCKNLRTSFDRNFRMTASCVYLLILRKLSEHLFYRASLRNYRRIHRRCSVRKGVLRNFAKFPGKHLRQSLFQETATLLKTRPRHKCLPVNSAKFLRTTFYITSLGDCFCNGLFDSTSCRISITK